MIFDYEDYKKYLKEAWKAKNQSAWGMASAFAKAIGCQVAYISQVLKGSANLSLEQAEALSEFFHHSRSERQYFYLMIQYARAGKKSLALYFQVEMQSIVKSRHNLQERLKVESALSGEKQAEYYSSWLYSAVHVTLSLPGQTPESISERLGVGVDRVTEVLEMLTSVGLATIGKKGYAIGTSQIFLGKSSPLISKHHINWRMQAIQSLDKDHQEDLHYSSVVTLSVQDVLKIKSLLVKEIEKTRGIINKSKEEELYSYCLDFFKV